MWVSWFVVISGFSSPPFISLGHCSNAYSQLPITLLISSSLLLDTRGLISLLLFYFLIGLFLLTCLSPFPLTILPSWFSEHLLSVWIFFKYYYLSFHLLTTGNIQNVPETRSFCHSLDSDFNIINYKICEYGKINDHWYLRHMLANLSPIILFLFLNWL